MSYEPSHRKPPRQERWPNATPGEGWPAYQQGDDGHAWESGAAYAGSRNGYGAATSGYGDTWGGRSTTGNGYSDAWGGAHYNDPGSGYRAAGNGNGGTTT